MSSIDISPCCRVQIGRTWLNGKFKVGFHWTIYLNSSNTIGLSGIYIFKYFLLARRGSYANQPVKTISTFYECRSLGVSKVCTNARGFRPLRSYSA